MSSPQAQRSPATGRRFDPPGVLIVDDENGVRQVVAAWLTHQGFPVWLAADGREAVEAYRRHQSAIRIALLDVLMPDRDGPGVLADLRAICPDLRACFMTGNSGRYTQDELVGFGALAVFPKPLHLGEMVEELLRLAVA